MTVCAATTPARCAAPPAPAMMISMPRPMAPDAYSATIEGVRCADITRLSWPTPNFVSISLAARMASQSDLLPMMIPTNGFESDIPTFYGRTLGTLGTPGTFGTSHWLSVHHCDDGMAHGAAVEPAHGAGSGEGNGSDRGLDHDDNLLDEGYDSAHESILNAAFS